MQHKKQEYFYSIEHFNDDDQELNGGATPSLMLVGEHVSLASLQN